MQSITVLSNRRVVNDVLTKPARFWRYDEVERRLVRIDCRTWLDDYREQVVDPDLRCEGPRSGLRP